MKRRNESSTDNNISSKTRIFRKQDLEDAIELSRLDDDEPEDDAYADRDNYDQAYDPDDEMHFDFDDRDVERYRRKNQEEYGGRSESQEKVYHKQDIDIDPDDTDDDTDRSSSKRKGIFIDTRPGKNKRPDAGDTVMFGMVNKKQTNKEIRRAAYVMLLLMFGVIAYIIYFNLALSKDVVNNSNNSLLSKLEEKVVRGTIYSADGEILAQSLEDSNGDYYRNYPYSNVFAHVVGTSEVNKSGIEQAEDYDLITTSVQPAQKVLNDLRGIRSPANDVVTTLDSKLQQVAYDQLGYSTGVVIALEPSTGKVLAMVSKPDFDPNTLPSNYESILNDSDSTVLLNQATQGVFVPGSIFKVVTTLAYLRSGYDPDTYSYNCQGYISLSSDDGTSPSISCYSGEVHGQVDLVSSFAESCNSSFANIGQNISPSKMRSVATDMLFNTSLPTKLKAVQSVFNLSDYDTDWTIGATAIGQGRTQMSPLHAAMLVSAIANDGELMEPYVVDKVVSSDGSTVSETSPESYGDLMSASEVRTLKTMMEAVVTDGTGYNLQWKSYSSAGKTGTAEVSGQGNNAWYIGYAPADDPQIAVCVLVEDSSGTGSSVAVPIAGALFDEYLNVYD